MPRYKIVIADPDLAQRQEIARNVAHNLKAHGAHLLGPQDQKRLEKTIVERVSQMVGPAKQKGDLHTEMDSECPDGLPNCRNCGDPAYADACRLAGHCEHCGTRHGIAPDATVKANGYALEDA
jgi:hypothetical protein